MRRLAYLEKGLWDGRVRREHAAVLGWCRALPGLSRVPGLAVLVPLLAQPQSTHYVLDGFVWRRRTGSPGAPRPAKSLLVATAHAQPSASLKANH